MSIILRRNINDIKIQQAVDKKENLPTKNNSIRDTRYVKDEAKYYMFVGNAWLEIELVLE
jgi:hypothetical protein